MHQLNCHLLYVQKSASSVLGNSLHNFLRKKKRRQGNSREKRPGLTSQALLFRLGLWLLFSRARSKPRGSVLREVLRAAWSGNGLPFSDISQATAGKLISIREKKRKMRKNAEKCSDKWWSSHKYSCIYIYICTSIVYKDYVQILMYGAADQSIYIYIYFYGKLHDGCSHGFEKG